MKKLLLLLSMTFLTPTLFAQCLSGMYDMTFDDSLSYYNLKIGTTPHPNKVWQIAKPQKTNFTNASSPLNVIVTDSINPYPINDTSIFVITNTACEGIVYQAQAIFAGSYFVNSDSLTDYGTIEFSPDKGTTWINLVSTTTYSNSIFWAPKPTLTGNSNGWQSFYVSFSQLGPIFNIQLGDTLLYRFTFISDGVQTNKDGLMFDDFHFEDWREGIQEKQNNSIVSIYPNPTNDQFFIQANTTDKLSVDLYDVNGRHVLSTSVSSKENVNVSILTEGVYTMTIRTEDHVINKKLVIVR